MIAFDYAVLYETEVRPRQRLRRAGWALGFFVGAGLTGLAISLLGLV